MSHPQMPPAEHPRDETLPPLNDATAATPEITEDVPHSPLPSPEINPVEQERNEWKDKAYRLAADMENLRRRHTQEIESARNFALQSFAKDLLPVADNLARALEAAPENDPLRNGVTMVAANLQQTLVRHGIQRIETAPGQPFSHDHHQVMAQVPSTFPANHVVSELQAGFTLNGRLLRAAFVTVSNGSPPESVN